MLAVGRGGAQQHAVCLNDTPTTSAYKLSISGTVFFFGWPTSMQLPSYHSPHS